MKLPHEAKWVYDNVSAQCGYPLSLVQVAHWCIEVKNKNGDETEYYIPVTPYCLQSIN